MNTQVKSQNEVTSTQKQPIAVKMVWFQCKIENPSWRPRIGCGDRLMAKIVITEKFR